MRSPSCRECGGTLADCRDVALDNSGDIVVRKMRCTDCGRLRKDLTFSLPPEYDEEIGFLAMTERLESAREAHYRRNGKGAYRRADTFHPATIRVWVSVTRQPRNKPRVGAGGWVVRGTPHTREQAIRAGSDIELTERTA